MTGVALLVYQLTEGKRDSASLYLQLLWLRMEECVIGRYREEQGRRHEEEPLDMGGRDMPYQGKALRLLAFVERDSRLLTISCFQNLWVSPCITNKLPSASGHRFLYLAGSSTEGFLCARMKSRSAPREIDAIHKFSVVKF